MRKAKVLVAESLIIEKHPSRSVIACSSVKTRRWVEIDGKGEHGSPFPKNSEARFCNELEENEELQAP
jgi:hypothetical protein